MISGERGNEGWEERGGGGAINIRSLKHSNHRPPSLIASATSSTHPPNRNICALCSIVYDETALHRTTRSTLICCLFPLSFPRPDRQISENSGCGGTLR